MPNEHDHTLDFILQRLDGAGLDYTVSHYSNRPVRSVFQYEDERKDGLAFYVGSDPEAVQHLRDCTLVCLPGLEGVPESVTAIRTPDPRLAFYRLSHEFAPEARPPGIHPTAVVSPEAQVHPQAYVGPHCVLGRCQVGPGVSLVSHVSLLDGSVIGANTRVEPGACIGATGVVWAWGPDGRQWEMAQLGGVRIGEECFVGSNVSVVRGSLKETIIEDRCHIAHGSMIGHDVRLGESVHLANNVALGGACTIGERSFLGSGCSCRPAVELARNTVVGTGAVVVGDHLEPGQVLVGVPARPMERNANAAGVPRDMQEG